VIESESEKMRRSNQKKSHSNLCRKTSDWQKNTNEIAISFFGIALG
jgi:hypothetical protein